MSSRLACMVVFLCAGSACAPTSDDAWQIETPRPFLAADSEAFAPAIGDDAIFFCGGHAGTAASELVAATIVDGVERWRVGVQSCDATPALVESTVVAFTREAHTPRVVVYGFDAGTGRQRWRIAVGPITAHAVLGRTVFVARRDGTVQRLNAADGSATTVALKRDATDPWWMSDADGQLLLGSGSSVWKIDSQFKPVAIGRLEARVPDVVAAAAEKNLLVLQDRRNGLTAFNRTTGNKLWEHRWIRLLGHPSVYNGRVFVNTFGPNRYELVALDATSGGQVWSVQDGGFEAPTVRDGRLYAAGRSSVLIIDPATGAVRGEVKARTEIVSSPLARDGRVFFGTINGVLHAATLRP